MRIFPSPNESLYAVTGSVITAACHVIGTSLLFSGVATMGYAIYLFFAELTMMFGIGSLLWHAFVCWMIYMGGGVLILVGVYVNRFKGQKS